MKKNFFQTRSLMSYKFNDEQKSSHAHASSVGGDKVPPLSNSKKKSKSPKMVVVDDRDSEKSKSASKVSN